MKSTHLLALLIGLRHYEGEKRSGKLGFCPKEEAGTGEDKPDVYHVVSVVEVFLLCAKQCSRCFAPRI